MPLVAALVAVGLGTVVPLVSPLLLALLLGALVANSRWAGHRVLVGQARVTKLLLRLGVVALGLKLSVGALLDIGLGAVVVVVATVAVTYTATVVIGDRLGLDKGLVTLVAAGFSICGAAAIAAVDDAVRAKERHVALAVGLVTVFGSVMIVLVPWLGGVVGFSDDQTAVWAGASIHEVAQVVAAASVVGAGAIAVATIVKLGRVALLAPMYAVASRRGDSGPDRGVPVVPWFVVGFALAVAARSTGVVPGVALDVADVVTTLLLAAGMFGLGLGIRMRELWPVPTAALVLATASTAVALGTSGVLVALLVR